ncbi:MAG TPA: LPS export ABC transporter periplasmic protein LptC [Chthoniobacterales bacterium]|nr:LPS export ABC transporter periplasmic protein LptC [Chthoniobacterales bacterium]
MLLVGSCAALAGDGKRRKATPSPSPEGLALKNIPLTVGHEAKGLVLPNYDLKGHLLGRFEAATAARIDENHVRFTDLKMVTFDEKEKPNFNVEMARATLNLETRVIDSEQRTKLKRADFEIAGDTMEFNTMTHQGTMAGNVRMTIFNQKDLGSAPKP